MAEDDLDADAFLNIKMENFEEEDLFGNNDALMEKFIQVMQPTQPANYSLPPLQKVPTKTSYQDKSKPKSFMQPSQQQNDQYFYNSSNKAVFEERKISNSQSRKIIKPISDDISEIDINSDSRSQYNIRPASLKKNNLMQSHGSEMYDGNSSMGGKNKLVDYDRQNSSFSGSLSGAGKTGSMPPFYPSGDPRTSQLGITKRQQELLEKQEERVKIAEEWGWQKEETGLLWEARAKARKGVQKKKNLTADEKLARFRAINHQK